MRHAFPVCANTILFAFIRGRINLSILQGLDELLITIAYPGLVSSITPGKVVIDDTNPGSSVGKVKFGVPLENQRTTRPPGGGGTVINLGDCF